MDRSRGIKRSTAPLAVFGHGKPLRCSTPDRTHLTVSKNYRSISRRGLTRPPATRIPSEVTSKPNRSEAFSKRFAGSNSRPAETLPPDSRDLLRVCFRISGRITDGTFRTVSPREPRLDSSPWIRPCAGFGDRSDSGGERRASISGNRVT